MKSEAIDAIWSALWLIMGECEGHRFGQSGYDITLDHIYETAAHARDIILTEQTGRTV